MNDDETLGPLAPGAPPVRAGVRPTPETILTLHFANGRTVHIGFWGGETFELSPRHLDPRTQFLISSPALGDLIRQKTQR